MTDQTRLTNAEVCIALSRDLSEWLRLWADAEDPSLILAESETLVSALRDLRTYAARAARDEGRTWGEVAASMRSTPPDAYRLGKRPAPMPPSPVAWRGRRPRPAPVMGTPALDRVVGLAQEGRQ